VCYIFFNVLANMSTLALFFFTSVFTNSLIDFFNLLQDIFLLYIFISFSHIFVSSICCVHLSILSRVSSHLSIKYIPFRVIFSHISIILFHLKFESIISLLSCICQTPIIYILTILFTYSSLFITLFYTDFPLFGWVG